MKIVLIPVFALALLLPTRSRAQQGPVAVAGMADTLSTASHEAIEEEAQRVKHDDLARMSEEARLPSGQIITEITMDGDGWHVGVVENDQQIIPDVATTDDIERMMRLRGAKLPVHVFGPGTIVVPQMNRALLAQMRRSIPKKSDPGPGPQ